MKTQIQIITLVIPESKGEEGFKRAADLRILGTSDVEEGWYWAADMKTKEAFLCCEEVNPFESRDTTIPLRAYMEQAIYEGAFNRLCLKLDSILRESAHDAEMEYVQRRKDESLDAIGMWGRR